MAFMKKLDCDDILLAGDFGTNDLHFHMTDADFAQQFVDLWACSFPPLEGLQNPDHQVKTKQNNLSSERIHTKTSDRK